MAKRKKVIPVVLTSNQRERLERLWFYYGNYGPKATPGNHSRIQRLLENGYDERPLHTRRTPRSELPTPECEAAVEAVLAMKRGEGSEVGDGESRGLRVIGDTDERRRSEVDPETKAMPDDIRQRQNFMCVRLEDKGNAPEAA
ncbi:MAG TPA: hypothetical protein VD861_05470 [Pyrinomonadaceae bacterium]|nr:hypothetical protein [Pyrinomonadaceae bacterium]